MQQKPIPILMYHSIANMPKGTPMRSLHVPPRRFAWQMKLLKWLGYKGVNMSELLPYLKGEKTGKVVGITFDDGYRNNLTQALPVLKKHGFSATCYLVSENIGGNNYWDLDKGIPENPIMNHNEIKSWIASGMEIGSHAQHHIRLSQYNSDIITQEVSLSKDELTSTFNCTINHFCYPYGDYNDQVVDAVKSAGYQSATTVNRARATSEDNPWMLPRVFITHRTFTHLFLMKILGRYEDKHRQ